MENKITDWIKEDVDYLDRMIDKYLVAAEKMSGDNLPKCFSPIVNPKDLGIAVYDMIELANKLEDMIEE